MEQEYKLFNTEIQGLTVYKAVRAKVKVNAENALNITWLLPQ